MMQQTIQLVGLWDALEKKAAGAFDPNKIKWDVDTSSQVKPSRPPIEVNGRPVGQPQSPSPFSVEFMDFTPRKKPGATIDGIPIDRYREMVRPEPPPPPQPKPASPPPPKPKPKPLTWEEIDADKRTPEEIEADPNISLGDRYKLMERDNWKVRGKENDAKAMPFAKKRWEQAIGLTPEQMKEKGLFDIPGQYGDFDPDYLPAIYENMFYALPPGDKRRDALMALAKGTEASIKARDEEEKRKYEAYKANPPEVVNPYTGGANPVQLQEEDMNGSLSARRAQKVREYIRKNWKKYGFEEEPREFSITNEELKRFRDATPEERVLMAAQNPYFILSTSPYMRLKNGKVHSTHRLVAGGLGTAWPEVNGYFILPAAKNAPGVLAHEFAHLWSNRDKVGRGVSIPQQEANMGLDPLYLLREEQAAAEGGGQVLYEALKDDPELRMTLEEATKYTGAAHDAYERDYTEEALMRPAEDFQHPSQVRDEWEGASRMRTRYDKAVRRLADWIKMKRFQREYPLPGFDFLLSPIFTPKDTDWVEKEISRPEVNQQMNWDLGER